ncbi:MAG: 4Fe-4S dicluster domain-containing protein [Planctomycetota bacterium]|jgi:ferredoxin-type protein NapG
MNCSRRNFFRAGVEQMLRSLEEGIVACGAQVPENEPEPMPSFLRPPGALAEADFVESCSACDDCIKACPKQAIRKAGTEFGEALAGLPIIIAEDTPCWMCKDLPCITACETGALHPVSEPAAVRMGLAVVNLDACYSALGSICESCQEACPVRPRSIRVRYGSSPEVDAESCTGCGVCVYLCPADAVEVRPA